MATIVARKRKSGIRYTAQIRIKKSGNIIHTESHTFDKKSHAQEWAKKREVELKEPGAVELANSARITIGDVLKIYVETFNDNNTQQEFGRSKLAHIKQLQEFPISEVDAVRMKPQDLVDHILTRLKSGISTATAGNDLIWLRIACRSVRVAKSLPLNIEAIEDASQICRLNKLVAKSKSRDRRPDLDELSKILEHYDNAKVRITIPMMDIVIMAIFSGRRQEEITRLLWEDLDLKRSRIIVRQMKHPRLKKDTFVHLPNEALAIIDKQERIDDEPRIFPFNCKSISASFTRTCKLLEINDLRFHDLRHECASLYFERGYSITQVAGITGHQSWNTLKRYTHLSEHEPFDKYESWKWLP